MAQGVVRVQPPCDWNPDAERRWQPGDPHLATARFVTDAEGEILKLCKDCAALPRFRDARKQRL